MIRLAPLPAALAVALVFHAFEAGRFLQRAFFSMWLHELGHAVAAWFCGRMALPGPWFTPIADERSWVLAGVAAGLLAFGAWRHRSKALGAVLAMQLVCTLFLSRAATDQLFLWAGDGLALLFACACMGAFFSIRGSVRWGLLVIGAATFVDVFSVWWAASSDFDLIPYGANEGVGASDPTRLNEDFGWSSRQIVNRFLGAGIVGLLGLAAWIIRLNVVQTRPGDAQQALD